VVTLEGGTELVLLVMDVPSREGRIPSEPTQFRVHIKNVRHALYTDNGPWVLRDYLSYPNETRAASREWLDSPLCVAVNTAQPEWTEPWRHLMFFGMSFIVEVIAQGPISFHRMEYGEPYTVTHTTIDKHDAHPDEES